jgi:hypothetical protein
MLDFLARAKAGPLTSDAKVAQLGKSIAFLKES